jgi:hypothetical protein
MRGFGLSFVCELRFKIEFRIKTLTARKTRLMRKRNAFL